MRRLIFLLVVLLVSVIIGIEIHRDPGYLLLVYRDWSLEMPLWFAAMAFILVFLVTYCLVRLLVSIGNSWRLWVHWLRVRRKNKAYDKTHRGLIELIEGHWSAAEYLLLKGVSQVDFPLINYLAAAKAAHEQGAYDRRDEFLQKAYLVAPRAEVAIGLTKAELQLNQGQFEAALATLTHLQTIAPRHPYVLKLSERLYVRLADWSALLKLLPALRKAKVITADQHEDLECHVYQELLKSTENKVKSVEALRQVWQRVPKKLQHHPRVIQIYAKLLSQYSYTADEVESLLTASLKKNWDKELIEWYGLLVTSHSQKQLNNAENWLKRYGNQAALLLALGRISMRCQLWSKARGYFEESLRLETNPETYAECGKLLEQLGDVNSAVASYRSGLLSRDKP